MIKKTNKFPSELRFDPMGRDWVVIARGRALRPETFKKEKKKEKIPSVKTCPFCNISSQEKPTLILLKGKEYKGEKIPQNWSLVVIPNKYPAFTYQNRLNKRKIGIYNSMDAVGFHEVVVTKDHKKQFSDFSPEEFKEVIDAYQKRYLNLMKKRFINYIFIFHNQGREAGASIFHPHSQIIATPLVDPDLKKAIDSAKQYSKSYKKCVYCFSNKWELKAKKRIVFENKHFLAICPFASKVAFEVIISPKQHLSYFERITEKEKKSLAEIFCAVLKKLKKALNNLSYNFYLHTAPCAGKNYDFYHWHFTILPKTATPAGFEFGAKMEISTIEPEKAAEYLRKQ